MPDSQRIIPLLVYEDIEAGHDFLVRAFGLRAGRLDRDAILVALGTLSTVQREALELGYFSGLTQQEIAVRTNAPLGTVKSRMRLGLLQMRRAMLASGPEGGEPA